jgi:haloacetate dehalogenase
MWHSTAPALAADFAVVCADLRGYGGSGKPPGTPDHANYSKRTMAIDMIEVMAALGHRRFMVAGHDRGGRVAYRLALDHPAVVDRLALIDIVSTKAVYEMGGLALASAYFHWYFLIQPKPLPERLIGHDPAFWIDSFLYNLAANSAAFDPLIVAEYLRVSGTAEAIHAACEDYRAGATVDLHNDRADALAGRRIECPTLLLWGARSVVGRLCRPLLTWRDFLDEPRGEALDCGHFVPEERAADTVRSLREFFRA